MFLTFLFCTLFAFADIRTLTAEESEVFCKIWGVRDMESLVALVENPKKFWEEREKDLLEGPNQVMTHKAFCAQYIADAKKFIAQKLEGAKKKPWFKKPEAIDDVVKDCWPEDHPDFMDVRLFFYAAACDRICGLHDKDQSNLAGNIRGVRDIARKKYDSMLKSEKQARTYLKNGKWINVSYSHTLRWQVLLGGEFSLIDSLILRRRGFHLCSVSSDFEERTRLCLHSGQFEGWLGAYEHDVLGHASGADKLSRALENRGVSYQEYFDRCCNPEDLLTGDLVAMSLQVQAWFVQFHELPAAENAYTSGDLFSMVFPSVYGIVDPGFMSIAPYFMQLPAEYNWRETPLPSMDWRRWSAAHARQCLMRGLNIKAVVNNYLLGWRSQYCFQGVRFLTHNEVGRYFELLEGDCRYFCSSDFERSPQFLRGVLEHLYALEQTFGEAQAGQSFESFEEKSYMLARSALCALEHFAPEHKNIDLNVPHSVWFLMVTSHLDWLRKVLCLTEVRMSCSDFTFGCSLLDGEILAHY